MKKHIKKVAVIVVLVSLFTACNKSKNILTVWVEINGK